MLRVVIVEDEEIIRNGLVYSFDWLSRGCVVVGAAESGAGGMRLIESETPELVIVDINMPGMGGIEMIEQARQCHNFKSIIITGYSDFAYAKKAIALDVVEYLLKPVDEAELVRALEKVRLLVARERLLSGVADKTKTNQERRRVDLDNWLINKRNLSRYVRAAIEIIIEKYAENISVALIAHELDVSVSYLSRKFKEETNQTILEILHKYRVQKTLEIFQSGKLHLYEAAEQAGFSDYKQFSVVFKKHVGVSPKAFVVNAHLSVKRNRSSEQNR